LAQFVNKILLDDNEITADFIQTATASKITKRTHDDIKKWHAANRDVPPPGNFYIKLATRLWRLLSLTATPKNSERLQYTHATVMRDGKLKKHEIPGSAIMIDEVQDLNKNEISWLLDQVREKKKKMKKKNEREKKATN